MKFKFSELLLLYMSDNTLVYDIIELLGLENTLKLFSVFEGEQITIPSKKEIRDAILNLYIYSKLHLDVEDKEARSQLCSKYKISENELMKRFEIIYKDLEESNILKGLRIKRKELEIMDVEKFILDILE